MTNDIAVKDDGINVNYFDRLVQNADRVDGGELVDPLDLPALIGCPLAITRLTYRQGDITQKGETEPGPYVSVEMVLGNETWFTRRRVVEKWSRDAKRSGGNPFPFFPEDGLVYNDGSTGIYRQVTEYLDQKGFIVVGGDLPAGGPKGESKYDLAPHHWADFNVGEFRLNDDGFGLYEIDLTADGRSPLFCVRGFRVSEYENQFTKEGATYYLA